MAEYTSGAINFAGLGNGTDFNALIDGLMNVEKRRVARLEIWKSSWQQKNDQFKELNTMMVSLKTTLESMDTISEFMKRTVNSSNPNIVTATATDRAEMTNHTIEVGQLAVNDMHVTDNGVSSLGDSITENDTNFTFSYAGESYTISNIGAGTSVARFVDIINSDPRSRDKIRASTIYDGSQYHLQISGRDLGAENQVVISNTGTMVFSASDFAESQNAVNSQIKVNGFPSAAGGWIESASNSISNVIEGVTLNLKDAQPGATVKISLTTDTAAIKENIVKFVDEINKVRTKIEQITMVDNNTDSTSNVKQTGNTTANVASSVKGSILTGNYGVDMVAQNLKNIMAGKAPGFIPYNPETGEGDKYSSLSQLGILTDADKGSETYGLLKIYPPDPDPDKVLFDLDKALADDPEAVARLFATNLSGESNTADITFGSLVAGHTKAGIYEVEYVSDGTTIVSATINGEEASISGSQITAKSGDATGMGLWVNDLSAGTHTGTVSVRQGKISEAIDELKVLTEPYNEFTNQGGPLNILQENYKDIMTSINHKIDYENRRIDKLELTYRLKFSRLDALLGQYQLKQGQLDNQIGQLE